jgi:hypothetical protein
MELPVFLTSCDVFAAQTVIHINFGVIMKVSHSGICSTGDIDGHIGERGEFVKYRDISLLSEITI